MRNSSRRIAQRTCVACRQVKDKKDLVRLASDEDGNIEIDKNGRQPGRGVYVCRNRDCWKTALSGNRLEHSLRRSLKRDRIEQLAEIDLDTLEGVSSG